MTQSINERLRRKAARARAVLRERREPPAAEQQEGRALRQQVARLRKRVLDLEQEVQELRRLSHRVAELADLVQELLVPAAKRDDERLKELLDDYDHRALTRRSAALTTVCGPGADTLGRVHQWSNLREKS